MSEHSPEPTSPAGSSWGQSQGHIPSPNVQATMTQMTSQLQTVIDAAERAAEAIRFDAEEQARHHLAEAQRKADRLTAERVGLISDLTDDLIRHAATVVVLRPSAAGREVYLHELRGATPVLDWITGTALTEVRARLSPQQWEAFRQTIIPLLDQAYPPRPDGVTFFPFRRVFTVAQVR